MLLGETRAALVQTMEELLGMVKENESKVLMVECEVEDGCMKEVPHLWKRIQLTGEAGGSLFQLLVDGNEFLEKGVRSPLLAFISITIVISITIISTNSIY